MVTLQDEKLFLIENMINITKMSRKIVLWCPGGEHGVSLGIPGCTGVIILGCPGTSQAYPGVSVGNHIHLFDWGALTWGSFFCWILYLTKWLNFRLPFCPVMPNTWYCSQYFTGYGYPTQYMEIKPITLDI